VNNNKNNGITMARPRLNGLESSRRKASRLLKKKERFIKDENMGALSVVKNKQYNKLLLDISDAVNEVRREEKLAGKPKEPLVNLLLAAPSSASASGRKKMDQLSLLYKQYRNNEKELTRLNDLLEARGWEKDSGPSGRNCDDESTINIKLLKSQQSQASLKAEITTLYEASSYLRKVKFNHEIARNNRHRLMMLGSSEAVMKDAFSTELSARNQVDNALAASTVIDIPSAIKSARIAMGLEPAEQDSDQLSFTVRFLTGYLVAISRKSLGKKINPVYQDIMDKSQEKNIETEFLNAERAIETLQKKISEGGATNLSFNID